MKTNDNNAPVEVFSGTIVEAEIVKSLLENAEIETFLNDELIGTLAPWNAAPGGLGAVKIVVSTLDYDKAMVVVEEYQKNKTGN